MVTTGAPSEAGSRMRLERPAPLREAAYEALMELIRLSYRALESAGTGAPRGAADLREPSGAAQAQAAAACAAAAGESNECLVLAKVGAGNLLHLLVLGCSGLYTQRVAADELALSLSGAEEEEEAQEPPERAPQQSSLRPHTLVA